MKAKHVPTMRERFDAKWKVDPITGCWVWTAGKFPCGHGAFRETPHTTDHAQRTAYKIHIGPLNPNDCVLHSCGNFSCVNPDHLFVGSAQDRADNSWPRRQAKPLSDADVAAARSAYVTGTPTKELASTYGVSQPTMQRIVSGRARTSVGGSVPLKRPQSRLSESTVAAMLADWAAGETVSTIASRYGLSRGYAHRVVSGATPLTRRSPVGDPE